MAKSTPEYVTDFLLELLPGLLPKPLDSVAKSAVATFKDKLDSLLKQPRLRRELLEAARNAEGDFRARAKQELGNDELTQRVASLPLYDRELFQRSLQSLPEHLNEDILAGHLQRYISDDWKGDFTPEELRKGTAIYLNCLKVRLLNVEGFGDLIARLEVLRTGELVEKIDERTERTDKRTERIEEKIDQLIKPETAYSGVAKTNPESPKVLPDFYVPRDGLLEQIKSALGMDRQEGGGKTVAITALLGIGGVGKTILAQAIANDKKIKDTFQDGLLWASLGPEAQDITSADESLSDWLIALQVDPRQFPDTQTKAEVLRHVLAEQNRLLVVDDVWYEEAAAPFLSIRTEHCALLITSRDRELVTRLGVTKNARIDVDALTEMEARDLVQNITGEVDDEDWEKSIKPVMERIGWHALAVQLAAKQVSLDESWENLLQALIDVQGTERLDFDDPKTREQSLYLTFKLSTDRLDEEMKKRFAWLGALAPSEAFFLEDAAWLWVGVPAQQDSNSTSEKEISIDLEGGQSTLKYLSRRGLLEKEQADGNTQYRMHLLLWEHANQMLRGVDEQDAALKHHAAIYAAVIENDSVMGSNRRAIDLSRPQWRSVLERAWVSHANEKGLGLPDVDFARKTIKQLASSLAEYWDMRGFMSEGILWRTRAIEVCRSLKDRQGEGVHLGNLGLAYAALGDAKKAIEYHEKALVAMQEIGNKRAEGSILGNLGLAYAALGDAKKAIDFYEKYLSITREIGDRRGEGNALGNLGIAFFALGDAKKAIDFYEKQLVIVREIGDRRGEGNALGNLGGALYALGDAKKAIEFYEQALVIDREIGDRRGEGADLANLGIAYKNLGEKEKARGFWNQALQIYRAIESPHAARVEQWLAALDGESEKKQEVAIQDFVRAVIQAHRSKSPQAGQLFEALGKMIGDFNAPPEVQELAKVLRRVMSGIKEPDLSNLPEELANLVREELTQKE